MKFLSLVACTMAVFSAHILAADLPDLAAKRNCTECHAIDRKAAGPSFADIARYYKGNREAPLFLAYKIQNGGKGVWGRIAMPSQHVTEGEAKKLANLILGLKPDSPPLAIGSQETAQDQM